MVTEASIQKLLFEDLVSRQHTYITPNSTVLGWEGDLISVTKAGLVHEYEIKLSRSDFKADLRKVKKHQLYKRGGSYIGGAQSPNYFFYVAPAGVIKQEDIPAHAGFIEIVDNFRWALRKRAPRLHERKITKETLTKLATSLMWRVFKYGTQYNQGR